MRDAGSLYAELGLGWMPGAGAVEASIAGWAADIVNSTTVKGFSSSQWKGIPDLSGIPITADFGWNLRHKTEVAVLKTDELASVARYQTFELPVRLTSTPDNVFDVPLSVVAEFSGPAGATRRVSRVQPFWFQNFTRRQLANGSEVLDAAGKPHFLVRFSAAQPGTYTYTLHGATGVDGATTSGTVRVSDGGDTLGFASVAPGQQYFRAGDSAPLFLLGENIVFPGPDPILTDYNYTSRYPAAHTGTFMYDNYFAKLAAAGGNYVRLWIGLSCLPPKGTPVSLAGGHGARFGAYSLEAAWRIDHILRVARRLGIYVLLCFEAQQSFQIQHLFNASIYSAANGGPLTSPAELWTSSKIQAEFKQRLRYAASAYGSYTSVFAWQFYNEHNDFPHFVAAQQVAWVTELSEMMREYDDYDHIIHDSFGGLPLAEFNTSIDFATFHHCKYSSAFSASKRGRQRSCAQTALQTLRRRLFKQYPP